MLLNEDTNTVLHAGDVGLAVAAGAARQLVVGKALSAIFTGRSEVL